MSPFPWEDITKASLSVELGSLAFMLLVIVMTHILGLESLAVHLPATASLSSSSSASFGIALYVQVMRSFIHKHGSHIHKLERPWACRALWEDEDGDQVLVAPFS